MNVTTARTIRARIHDSAIRRVTRTFAASLADAFTELLQNSRRAGATRVRVALAGSDADLAVTVTDDGAGNRRSGGPALVRRERLERGPRGG